MEHSWRRRLDQRTGDDAAALKDAASPRNLAGSNRAAAGRPLDDCRVPDATLPGSQSREGESRMFGFLRDDSAAAVARLSFSFTVGAGERLACD